ncbi:hypothetical protein VTO42DRAFT_7380 [Malbranchea cinnamomea]
MAAITEVDSPVTEAFPINQNGPNTNMGDSMKMHRPVHTRTSEITALDAMVFLEAAVDNGAKYNQPPKWGVLKITNIPYSMTKEEVTCLMGKNAKLLPPELGNPIHIIMERSTAKTMDCYVEFLTPADAMEALRYVNGGLPSHPPRLGSRFVHVEMSSQDELLRALFPRAKYLVWREGIPFVLENTDPYSTGYQGLFTSEEIYNVVRHAEFPRRAPFAEKCPQRTYENMISTLYKFPWYATTLYTVEDRNTLFYALINQLKALLPLVKRKKTLGLNERLLDDLLFAGLRCPVFNERQKFALYKAAGRDPKVAMPISSVCWPFDTLIRKPSATEGQVTQLAQFLAQTSKLVDLGSDILPNTWNFKEHSVTNGLFGQVWFQWGLGNTHHSFQFAVEHELAILNKLAEAWAKAKNEERKSRAMAMLPN